jgi:hypothetical protein
MAFMISFTHKFRINDDLQVNAINNSLTHCFYRRLLTINPPRRPLGLVPELISGWAVRNTKAKCNSMEKPTGEQVFHRRGDNTIDDEARVKILDKCAPISQR